MTCLNLLLEQKKETLFHFPTHGVRTFFSETPPILLQVRLVEFYFDRSNPAQGWLKLNHYN